MKQAEEANSTGSSNNSEDMNSIDEGPLEERTREQVRSEIEAWEEHKREAERIENAIIAAECPPREHRTTRQSLDAMETYFMARLDDPQVDLLRNEENYIQFTTELRRRKKNLMLSDLAWIRIWKRLDSIIHQWKVEKDPDYQSDSTDPDWEHDKELKNDDERHEAVEKYELWLCEPISRTTRNTLLHNLSVLKDTWRKKDFKVRASTTVSSKRSEGTIGDVIADGSATPSLLLKRVRSRDETVQCEEGKQLMVSSLTAMVQPTRRFIPRLDDTINSNTSDNESDEDSHLT